MPTPNQPPPGRTGRLRGEPADAALFSSTVLVKGNADREEYERTKDQMQEEGAVLEHCPKCNALLDVSGCTPLTETTCPSCSALIKVLKEFHHFSLLSILGQGGAGTVYRAFDQTLERDVALKLLRNDHIFDSTYIEGLEREALVMASISHSHVVKVYSTGCKNGFYYIAMEPVTGGSLAQHIERQGRLLEATVLSVGLQLAEGLQAAYERGLLHRDVKPGNVLFSNAEMIKVSDFGLALPLERVTSDETADIWGTPDYIAPEKLLRRGEDVRSDIYSFGCTLFHCLAGVPPLNSTTVTSVLESRKAVPAPNIQALAPEVSGPTAAIIKRCLEIDPAKRYSSYHALIEQLRTAQGSEPRAKASPAPSKPAANTGSAKPSLVMWGIMFALLVLVSTMAALILHHEDKGQSAGPAGGQVAPPPAAVEKYHVLNLRNIFDADSRRGLFQTTDNNSDTIKFKQFGVVKLGDVPFDVVDPDTNGNNLIVLKGGTGHAQTYPQRIEIPAEHVHATVLHFLGGVGGWAYPCCGDSDKGEGLPAAKITVVYDDGSTEALILQNGVEIADYFHQTEVPGSQHTDLVDEHQIRVFQKPLARGGGIEKLVLESFDNRVAPLFAAITVEQDLSAAAPTPGGRASASNSSNSSEYRMLDMRMAYTVDTRRGVFLPTDPTDTLAFARFGEVVANGIPFELVDPVKSPTGFNLTLLRGGMLTTLPKSVTVPVPSLAIRRIHILGGIAGWAWGTANPRAPVNEPLVKFTVVHAGGISEEFTFRNGVEFCNHKTGVDVPGSTQVQGLITNGHQVRTFSVQVAQTSPVEKLLIESLHPEIAPAFVALTAELAR